MFLCFYQYKENGKTQFKISEIAMWLEKSEFSRPNTSRLKNNLTKGKDKVFLLAKSDKNLMEFVPAIFQALDREYGCLWVDTITIRSNDELIEEAKFCHKRPYLDRLIQQINATYGGNCYDACAVLMRGLFEVLLVLSYQNKGIEADITNRNINYRVRNNVCGAWCNLCACTHI